MGSQGSEITAEIGYSRNGEQPVEARLGTASGALRAARSSVVGVATAPPPLAAAPPATHVSSPITPVSAGWTPSPTTLLIAAMRPRMVGECQTASPNSTAPWPQALARRRRNETAALAQRTAGITTMPLARRQMHLSLSSSRAAGSGVKWRYWLRRYENRQIPAISMRRSTVHE